MFYSIITSWRKLLIIAFYPALPLEQPLPCEEEPVEEIAASVVMTDHDYGSAPKSGALDAAAARIQQLEETVEELSQLKEDTGRTGVNPAAQVRSWSRPWRFQTSHVALRISVVAA
ncbi:unnamed protein product [Boreogadus saida]